MGTSPNNTGHLFPERRMNMNQSSTQRERASAKTETSHFFAPSRSSDKPKRFEGSDDQRDSNSSQHQSSSTSRKQMLLSVTSQGKLTTKQPLTNPTPRSDGARLSLAEVAQETLSLLPGLLATRPDVGRDGHLEDNPGPLDPSKGPNNPPTKIRVIDMDTIDAALSLPTPTSCKPLPPLILNMANAQHAGGGFKHGALAQEEALCYRSSLFFTLKIRHYPIPDRGAIYSPNVLVIRKSIPQGHQLLDFRQPSQLPVVSVISAAAICLPETTRVSGSSTKQTYARSRDRDLMKAKMRAVLRTAAQNGHTQLVLGAFGCGAFRNPSWEVAEMWKEVLAGEKEFRDGGWWEDVVFAVLGQGTENFRVFENCLDGVMV